MNFKFCTYIQRIDQNKAY